MPNKILSWSVVCIAALTGASVWAQAPTDADREQLEQSAVKFVESFNARKLDDLAALFAKDAEVLRLDEDPIEGAEKIRKTFELGFAARPKAKVSLSMDSLRFISPTVAFENGTTVTYSDGETPTSQSRYTVIHVKQDGRWRMKLVREEEEQPLSPYARLQELEWLLGDWVDEGPDAVIVTSCKWDENKSFLLRDFEVKTRGDVTLKGQQRIGWDAASRQVRSWMFDNTGGFGDGTWTQVDDRWVIKSTGVRPDGQTASATQILTSLGPGRMEWKTEGRLIGAEPLPPLTVVLVRRAPAPATAGK
jgi:uncharacterized protein (TIGR02246 family)